MQEKKEEKKKIKNVKNRASSKVLRLLIILAFILGEINIQYASSARYTSKVQSNGESVVTIAYWDIETSGGDATFEANYLEGNSNFSYPFAVTNNSDVSANYEIKVVLPSALPQNCTMKLKNGSGTEISLTENNNLTYIYRDSTIFGKGQIGRYTLEFTVDTSSIIITTLENIEVKVVARQID